MSVSDEQRDKIIKASEGQFTREEVDNFLNISNNIANAAVLGYLIKVLTTDVAKENKSKTVSLVHDIEKLKYKKKTGYMSCNLLPQLNLNLGMVLCKSNYSFELNAPDDKTFMQDLADNIDKLLKITDAFWQQFSENNPTIISRAKELKPNINFDVLALDRIAMTKMFVMKPVEDKSDEEKVEQPTVAKKLIPATCNFRIAVFPCWVDSQGRPFIKK